MIFITDAIYLMRLRHFSAAPCHLLTLPFLRRSMPRSARAARRYYSFTRQHAQPLRRRLFATPRAAADAAMPAAFYVFAPLFFIAALILRRLMLPDAC